jgi:hypothetical protein
VRGSSSSAIVCGQSIWRPRSSQRSFEPSLYCHNLLLGLTQTPQSIGLCVRCRA